MQSAAILRRRRTDDSITGLAEIGLAARKSRLLLFKDFGTITPSGRPVPRTRRKAGSHQPGPAQIIRPLGKKETGGKAGAGLPGQGRQHRCPLPWARGITRGRSRGAAARQRSFASQQDDHEITQRRRCAARIRQTQVDQRVTEGTGSAVEDQVRSGLASPESSLLPSQNRSSSIGGQRRWVSALTAWARLQ